MYHANDPPPPTGTGPRAKHWEQGPGDLDQHAKQMHPQHQNLAPQPVQATYAPMHPRCVLHQLHSWDHLLDSLVTLRLCLLRLRRILSSTGRQIRLRRHSIHPREVVPRASFQHDVQGKSKFHTARRQPQTE